MLTRPDDLPETALTWALRDRWRFTAVSLEYRAVGFGSHHWLATDASGGPPCAARGDEFPLRAAVGEAAR